MWHSVPPQEGVWSNWSKKGHLVLVKCLFPTPHPPCSLHTSQPTSLSQSYSHICLVPTHCPVPASHRSLQTSSKPGLLWHQQLLTGASHLPGPSPAPWGLPRIPSAPWAKREAVSGSSSFSSSPTPPGCPVRGASDCPPGSGDTGCPLCSALFPALIPSTCFSR